MTALRAGILALLLAGAAVAQNHGGDALRDDIEFVRRKVYPALVNISVVVKSFGGGRTQRSPGAGSGVIVSPAGHVLTNFHVAGNTTRIVCTLPDGEAIETDVVCHDPLTDLSVLKLRLETRSDPTRPLPFATLGDSSALHVGDYVLAMGNPMGLSSSLTLGVVSNTGRVFTNFTGTELEEMDLGEGELTGLFTRWIQHDALILPGNSGGPLVNLRGEVVGINELGGGGMGFAIPSNLSSRVLSQVLAHGEVRRGWLGFSALPVGKLRRKQGALVASVLPGSPAEAAGLLPGDVVLAIDGRPVDVRFLEQVPELYQSIAEIQPGREVELTVERGAPGGPEVTTRTTPGAGGPLALRAKVGRMEPSLGDELELARVGLTVRAITGPMALARRLPDTKGVLVTGVRPGKPFEEAKPEVRQGDVLVEIGGKQIADLRGFAEVVGGLPVGKALVSYRRGQESLLTLLEIKPDEPKKRGGELRKAWLGVRTQVLTTPLAEALGAKGTRGFRVTMVLPWTKAAEAGLQAGDIIVSIAGEQLDAYRPRDAQELVQLVEQQPIGKAVPVGVVRGKERLELQVVMQESPATATDVETAEEEAFELKVREITFMDRVERRWTADQQGLLVTDATMGGWANMAGLKGDDLIVSIEDRPTPTVKAFKEVMAQVLTSRPPVVRFFVRRGHRTQFVFLEPDWSSVPQASPAQKQ